MDVLIYCNFISDLPQFIKKPPSSLTVQEKQNITITCEADGFPPPMVTWYKSDHAIDERKTFQRRELRFSEIKFEDRGIYTCEAENLLGSVQFTVNLTVQGTYELTAEQQ